MEKINFGKRLRELRKERNLSQRQVAEELFVGQTTISGWEKAKKEPSLDILQMLANYFDVTVDYLIGNEEKRYNPKGIKIPILGTIPAGIPIEAIEETLGVEEITYEMSKSGAFFALKVRGDSMSPMIENGDILIIRQQENFESGDICVVMINGNDATIKKVKRDEYGIMIIPINQKYEPIFYSNEQIESLPIRVIGKAVEIRRTI